MSQRLVVHGSMSRWPSGFCPETDIFVNDTDSETKRTLSQFANDAKLSSAVDKTEGWMHLGGPGQT